ncbi:MAG: DUF58 domain-containing protein [Nakamurella sp.]
MDSALAELEVAIRHRLDGLLHGNHLGLVPGPGSELGDARPYVPGDDVRRMDWAVTARTTVPHIRTTIADRELETWLAVDLSASMDFGTALCEKRDLAIVASAVMAHLTRGGGNRIGAVVAGGGSLLRLPARSGRPSVQHLLRGIASVPRTAPGARGDLAATLDQLRRPERRRGLVVAISDFLGPTDWERSMRALAARHDVIAIGISDPRDRELPPIGLVTVVDPESGRTKDVRVTRSLAERFSTAATAHSVEVAGALKRVGVPLLELSTERDWVGDVVRFVVRRKRGWVAPHAPHAPQVPAASVGAQAATQ